MKPGDTGFEPPLEPRSTRALWHQQNSEPDLAENEWVYGKLALVLAKPLDDAQLRGRLGALAQHVGVHEKRHKVSVESVSIGTK